MNKECKSHDRKKRYKKAGLAFCMVILLAAAGCRNAGSGSAESTTGRSDDSETAVAALEDVNQIPEDGVITKAQFETVAGQDKTIRFEGATDDGIEYVWIYDCSQIQNPESQNLKLEFETQGLDSVKKEADDADDALEVTMTQQGLICRPSLQIKLPGVWESDSCILVTEQNEELAKMCDVTIYTDPEEGDDGTTYLTMMLTAMGGSCYVVGGISEGMTAQADSGDEGGALWEGADDETSDGSGIDSDSKDGTGSGSSGGLGTSSGSSSSGSGSSGSSSSGSSSGSGSKGSSGNKSSASANTCTISINCSSILDNMDKLAKEKKDFVPSDGWILKPTEVEFKEGDSVHDVLQQVCKDKGIHMESSYTPLYNSAFVEGINQLYEFDCGELSGWTFMVNGWFPNYSCSKCYVSSGDEICWLYTCDLGEDVGSYVGY